MNLANTSKKVIDGISYGNYRLIEPQFHKVLMVNIRNMNIISEKAMSDRGAKFNTFQGKNFE
mgnify:FL=1